MISKTYNRLLVVMLSWLGFSTLVSSCAKYGCPDGEMRPEVTGTTISQGNGRPVQGIRVVLKDDYQGYDTAYTARNGGFYLKHTDTYCKDTDLTLKIAFDDVDGDANGVFEEKETTITSSGNIGNVELTPAS